MAVPEWAALGQRAALRLTVGPPFPAPPAGLLAPTGADARTDDDGDEEQDHARVHVGTSSTDVISNRGLIMIAVTLVCDSTTCL